MFKKGQKVKMTEDAIENYGEEYRNRTLTISNVATKYMPAAEFFAKGKPEGYHPGYDDLGSPLYDLEELTFSLYGWEVDEDLQDSC